MGAIIDANGTSVQRASIIDTDKTILCAGIEPTTIENGTRAELILRWELRSIYSRPSCSVFKDLDDELLSLSEWVT